MACEGQGLWQNVFQHPTDGNRWGAYLATAERKGNALHPLVVQEACPLYLSLLVSQIRTRALRLVMHPANHCYLDPARKVRFEYRNDRLAIDVKTALTVEEGLIARADTEINHPWQDTEVQDLYIQSEDMYRFPESTANSMSLAAPISSSVTVRWLGPDAPIEVAKMRRWQQDGFLRQEQIFRQESPLILPTLIALRQLGIDMERALDSQGAAKAS